MTEGTNLQQSSSMMEPGFDDDEIFFGPITDKEKLVKERFEKRMQEKGIVLPKLSNIIDESKNDFSEDSHYESFSTESKYDSFDDSLDVANIENNIEKNVTPKEINVSNFLSEQVNVNCRRLLADKKNVAAHFCDSLEDIHSLVSSGDKFSMSEEIEDINIMEISRTCEDSLRNDICVANRNSNSNEQYFDEDSLAILEYEKAFDDSLEDSNGPSLSNIDSLILSKSKVQDVDSQVEKETAENKVAKAYFETSIEVIYENSKEAVAGVKNLNSDRNSQAEGHLFRDSLEDLSELPNNNLSKASCVRKCYKPSAMHLSDEFSENELEQKSSKQNADIPDFNSSLNKIRSRKSSTGFMKPLSELFTSDNFHNTICIEDSVLPSDSILNTSSSNINTKSMKSNFKTYQCEKESKLLLNPLDSNDTICIDDSLISSSYSTACSFPANDFASKSTINDDLGSMEVDKAYVENAKPSNISNSNDTIWIEDSIIEPPDQVFSCSSNLALDCPKDKYASRSNTCEFSPAPLPKPLNVADVNETICIDDSIILPLESDVRKEKISPYTINGRKKNKRNSSLSKNFEKDFQKFRISDIDKQHSTDISSSRLGSPSTARNTMIDIVVRSPLHGCQMNSNVSEHSNLKDGTVTPEKVSTLIPGSLNERNLKVHIEVKSEGVNVISVSSVEQGCSKGHCASYEKDVACMSGGSRNLNSGLVNEFSGNHSNIGIVGGRLKSISADSKKKSPSELTSVSKGLDLHSKNFPNKKKIERKRYSDDFHVKHDMHEVSLLQALDLHDTSINLSRSRPLQSRDSIMPLNLCVRDKSFLRRNKPTPKIESKENIPFVSYNKFTIKEHKSPQHQKSKGSPKKNKGTPLKNKIAKQQPNNADVKWSGGKLNSATKIPIFKTGNAPSSQRKLKLDSKPACNSNKPIKSPFVVPACPSATLHKEVSGETPKKLHHHFCMVRNSISKVPKSSQKITSKKFQNIQSPIAKYIGNPSVQTPLKTTHRYDGNLFLASAEPSVAIIKTPKNDGFPATPCSTKSDKKF